MQIFNNSATHQSSSTSLVMPTRQAGSRLTFTLIALALLVHQANAWSIQETNRIPDGILAMCAVEGELWCGISSHDSTIIILNSSTGEVVRQIHAPEVTCRGIAYQGGSIWFLGTNHLHRMNVDGEIIASQNTPFAGMVGLAPDQNGLWTAHRSDGNPSLALFNLQGGLIRRLEMNISDALDLHFDGTNFWISSPPDGFIHQLSANGATVNIFPTPANTPTAITVIEGEIYLIDNGDDHEGDILYRISPESEPTPRALPGALLHSYGMINIFGSQVWELSIFNVGGSNLEISSIVWAQGNRGFTLGQLPQRMVVAPGEYMLARVTFGPSSYGLVSDTLIITSNDPIDSVISVVCQGIGVHAERTLGVSPELLDFGDVRADPARDGSKHMEMHLYNMGADPLNVELIENNIPGIFRIELPELPCELQPTDTLTFNIWFTPHRAITYTDTVTVRSTAVIAYNMGMIRGHGDATVYDAGEILWTSPSESDELGGLVTGKDVNDDGIREVYAFQSGSVHCLNGFSSVTADRIWTQSFEGMEFNVGGLAAGTKILSDLHLQRYDSYELIFASESADAAVYSLSQIDGELVWRWSSTSVVETPVIEDLVSGEDCDGNGTTDPIVLISDNGDHSHLCRLDGGSGHLIWHAEFPVFTKLFQLNDISGDGICDLLLTIESGRVTIVNGANGRPIHSYIIPEWTALSYLGLPDVREEKLVIAERGNGIVGLELLTGRIAWAIDDVDGVDSVGTITIIETGSENNPGSIICGDDLGNLIVVRNALTGTDAEGVHVEPSPITSLAWAPRYFPGYAPSILTGNLEGRVDMVKSDDLEILWSYQASPESGSIRSVLSFDDVDLGTTSDILVLLGNNDISCVSSGGDLAVEEEPSMNAPVNIDLITLYPNPFNNSLSLSFHLQRISPVSVTIFDDLGRKVGFKDFGIVAAGNRSLELEGSLLQGASGSLYCQVQCDGTSRIVRGIYLK